MTTAEKWVLVPVIAIGAYVALVPGLSLIPGIDPFNEKRALQIGLLVLTGSVTVATRSTRTEWLSTFYHAPLAGRWGLGIVLGLGGLSAGLAPAPYSAVLELSHFVLLFVAAGAVATAVRRVPRWTDRILFGAVVLSALLYAVYFFVGYGVSIALPSLDIGRETVSGFANTRFFNQYQTWTLPLLVGALFVLPSEWRVSKGTVFVLAALWWTLTFASNVRGTVVAVAVASGIVWFLFGRRAHRWLKVLVGTLVLGGALYYVLFTLGGGVAPQVVERMGQVGESRRLQHWSKCLRMAWAHPWLGVGPMHYAWPPYDFARAAHPHSVFFQWVAEWGIPSTAIMSTLTVWGGWRWLDRECEDATTASWRENGIRIAVVASLLAGAAHSMVSGIVVMPVSQVLLVLVGGWAWGRYLRHGEGAPGSVSVRAHVLLAVMVVASMAVVGSSLKDLATRQERQSAFLNAVDRRAFSPRYWKQGYIGVRDSTVIERARIDW